MRPRRDLQNLNLKIQSNCGSKCPNLHDSKSSAQIRKYMRMDYYKFYCKVANQFQILKSEMEKSVAEIRDLVLIIQPDGIKDTISNT